MIVPASPDAWSLPVAHEIGEQLGVVHDLVVAAEVGVLVPERVEAVGAARHDLRDAGLVQGPDVRRGLLLEEVLVAHAPCGVAGARLARAEDGEVHAGGLEQLGRGLRCRAGALVERRGAAHPIEHLRCRVARLQHAHAELGGPVGALGLRFTPRIRGALHVAQHLLGLRRERRVHHHQVAAQVDDVIHVLDRHRALAYARSTGHAVPHDVLGHGVRHQRRGREALLTADQPRPLLEHLVAQGHDQELRRELLAGGPGGADVLAAPALGAGEGVERLLPGEVGHRAGAEAHLLLGHVEAERLEAPARTRAREVDVERSRRDMEMLRVGEIGEEADDDQHVRPHEATLEHLRHTVVAEQTRERV